MMMIFPDGGCNQGSHFVHNVDCAKHKKEGNCMINGKKNF